MDPRAIERIGPYLVRRFVAEGGMAWVFEVVDPKFEGRRLALKMLKPEAAIGEEFERFKSEAGLLAEIDHPNLVTVFDAGRDEATGWLYYTMTFVDGGTLANVLAERGALPLEEVGRVVLNLLDGLAELHRNGIIHRDVKPQNLMIGSDGRVRLGDLGIARRERGSRRTRTGYAVGTVAYMAPEQARANRELTPASDVFAAGLVLYETLAGRTVYEGVEGVDSSSSNEVLGYLVALARTGEEIEITYPPEVDLPAGVRKVIERACRLDPEKRFPDAGAMRVALEQALEAPQAAPLSVGRWPLLAAGGVALGLVLFSVWWFLGREDASSRVKQSLALAAARRDEAAQLAERAKDLAPAPPKALIQTLDRAFEKADNRLTDARADAGAERFEAAGTNAERAREGFDAVCGELAGKTFADRAQRTADEASKQAALLREAGAPAALPGDWKKLEEALKPLGAVASGEPCALARAQLDRIEQGEQVRRDARRLQDGMKDRLPRLAQKAGDEARKALQLARAETSDAAEYRETLRQGEAQLAEGKEKEAAKDFSGARASYQAARERFELAAHIAPAARARAKVRRLEEAGSTDPGVVVSRKVATCDADWRAQKWGDAAKSCEEAAAAMEGFAEEGELTKGLELARNEARGKRDAARAEGADQAARKAWDQAEAQLATAEEERKKGNHDAARRAFDQAGSRFAEAQKKAIEVLAAAREQAEEARDALSNLGACRSLEAETAREHCQQAGSDLARASEAIEARKAEDAARILSTANGAIEQARRAEALFQGEKPQPPMLVSRTPKREVVEAPKDRTLPFEIEASDGNGDPLRFAWSFEGQPIEGSKGGRIEVRASRSGRLSVSVDDGRGGRLTESWSIELQNRPPQLTVTPKEDALTLRPGEKRSFQISASDPDGDPVKELQTRLDGKQVATGAHYEFATQSPGSYALEFSARDAGGERSVVSKKIRVEQESAGKKITEPTRTTAPVGNGPPDTEPWKAGVQAALARYEACLERKDLPCVKDVWPQLNEHTMFWQAYESRLSRADTVQIDINVLKMTHSVTKQGETVITEIDQTDSFPPGPSKKRRFRSVLLKRGTTNDWQFIEHKIEG